MGIISKTDAVSLLEPLMADLRTCVREGFDAYQQRVAPYIPLASSRGVANGVNEFVLQEVRNRIGVHRGAVIKEAHSRRRFLVYYKRSVTLQFKKLDKEMLPRNYPTETAKAFERQEDELFDCKPYPRLTVGYQLNAFSTEIAGVYLAHQIGKECIWWHCLDSDEGSVEMPFPTPNELPPLLAPNRIILLAQESDGKN